MRKLVATILAAGLVVGMLAGPAAAGKKKKVSDTFTLGPLAPLPIPSDAADTGCLGGEEGVHKSSVAFTTPGKGVLTVEISNFQGDWDLYLTDASGNTLAASDSSQLQGSPQTETITYPLAAKKEIRIVGCNWAGGPTADGKYTYVYKK